MEIVPRFFSMPEQSFFLFGPRGTGKSLWAKRSCQDALWVDLLDPATYRLYSSRPERIREVIDGNPNKSAVVLDEVQKVPELLAVVHGIIEDRSRLQFVLTGSSARKLKRGGVDLLAGRALVRTLHPFMAAELGERFRLEASLRHGLVPLVVASTDPGEVLKAYHVLYLKEEVQQEGLVRNIGSFSRFLEAISFSHASVLTVANVARECEVERKTVEGFIGILEDLLLSFRLPVFTRRAKRATARHPKFFLFDAGVFRSLRPTGPLDRPEEIEGAALEGLVVQHLRAWNAYRGGNNELYYWRTRSGLEVDVVLYGDDGFWAIEIKNSAKIHPRDTRSLRSFKEDYPESEAILLYRGKERLRLGQVLCLPCEEFLCKLHPSESRIDAAF
jgi:predicted AAA+ superfamily ATPase